MEQKNLTSYQTTDTLGKTGLELVVKVYNGALDNLQQAKKHYSTGDNQAGYESMEMVRKFIVHLYTTLDMEKGGDIAQKLSDLYTFVVKQIDLVQGTKNETLIDEIHTILENVRDGWSQLAEQTATKNKPAPADQNKGPGRKLTLSA